MFMQLQVSPNSVVSQCFIYIYIYMFYIYIYFLSKIRSFYLMTGNMKLYVVKASCYFFQHIYIYIYVLYFSIQV